MAVVGVVTVPGGTLKTSIELAESLGCRVLKARCAGGNHVLDVELDTVKTGNAVGEAAFEKRVIFRLL